MPKINGLELIAMTREIHKNMKFVVISGIKNLSMKNPSGITIWCGRLSVEAVNEEE